MDTKTPFHAYLMTFGSMTRENGELLRLSEETGHSTNHLYHAALGRPISKACAIAIVANVQTGRKIPRVTLESLPYRNVPSQVPARSDARRPANGLVRAAVGRGA